MRISLRVALLNLQLVLKGLPAYGMPLSTTCEGGINLCTEDERFLITATDEDIKKRADGIIRSDVMVNNGNCPKMTVIFARGTTEPGNVGLVAGPPFFDAMKKSVNDLAVQGVDYDASVSGFLVGGSPIGIKNMATLIQKSMKDCPDSNLVLSGYSQGAQVVHKAADSLPADMAAKVDSVIVFGDPLKGTAFKSIDQSKVMTICKPDDDICKGGTLILPAHLSYGQDADSAAAFALSKMK